MVVKTLLFIIGIEVVGFLGGCVGIRTAYKKSEEEIKELHKTINKLEQYTSFLKDELAFEKRKSIDMAMYEEK